MQEMSVVENVDLAKLEEGGGGAKIITDTDGGGWRGRLAIAEMSETKHRVVAVRTWLPD